MPADICTQKGAGSRFQKIVYRTHSPDISGKRKNKDSREIAQLSQQFSGQKKVYIAIGDEETIVANLWEKYRDLSYLCRWGRKKDKQICQEEELGISKLWLSIDNIKKLEKYREKTLGRIRTTRQGKWQRIYSYFKMLSRNKWKYRRSRNRMFSA